MTSNIEKPFLNFEFPSGIATRCMQSRDRIVFKERHDEGISARDQPAD